MNPVSFEVSNIALIWSGMLLTVGLGQYSISQSKQHMVIAAAASAAIILICAIGSYFKMQRINGEIEAGKIYKYSGVVTNYKRYQALEKYTLDKKRKLGTDLYGTYCLPKYGVINEGDKMDVEYVKIGGWASESGGICIIKYRIYQ